MTLVSVIVPTCGRHHYLQLTVRSILEQTHSNLELLIVADGHDPRTEELVHELSDTRASYHSVSHSGMPAAPRNEGLRRARGDILAFCDDDDLWHPEKLAFQVALMREGGWGFLATDHFYIDSYGEQLPYRNYYDQYYGEISRMKLYHSLGFICTASVVLSRAAARDTGEFLVQPELRVMEDFEYWLRLLQNHRGYLSHEKLVYYRLHKGSIQKDTPWGVFKARLGAERVVRITANIPLKDYLRKQAKLSLHFLLDLVPSLKRAFRQLQGKSGLPS